MNTKSKLISIITPSYNCAEFIGLTIESVLAQSYLNWELIIVDDKSEDNSIEIIQGYQKQDARIKLVQLPNNVGAARARTIAIHKSKGEYIAFLDSDDIWLPNKLDAQLLFMEINTVYFSCTKYQEIDEFGEKMSNIIKVQEKADYYTVLKSCPIGNSTVMYNATILGKFVVPDIGKNNDFALWLKILKNERFIYGLDKALVYYRIRRKSISRNKIDMIKYHWELFRNIERLSILYSFYLLINWVLIKLFNMKVE